MNMKNLINQMQTNPVQLIKAEELEDFLASCTIKLERDTLMSGMIRILQYEDFFITQEMTSKNEISLRLFKTLDEARALVQDHLDTYERMWDGCGCKVDYYS